MKNPKAFLLAIILAVLAFAMHFAYLQKERDKILVQGEPMDTLVATQNIPKNFKLDETMVSVEKIPRKWRQPGALASVEEVLGQISASPIQKGEQVLLTKLVSLEDAGLAYKIPKKKRGIAIAVYDVNAVGGHVKPGNYVDIIGTFDFGEGDKADMRTVTLFQNVHVLAVGDDLGQTTPQNVESGSNIGGDSFARQTRSTNGTIVVSLSPLDCQKIVLAQEMGTLTLSLRSLWEDRRFVELEKTSIHTAIGIPKKVRYRRKATYRTIRSGMW